VSGLEECIQYDFARFDLTQLADSSFMTVDGVLDGEYGDDVIDEAFIRSHD
jgi:hypothetical protein